MSRLAVLFKNDLKLFAGDWKTILILILLPFLSIGFFAYALAPYIQKSSFIEPFDIAVIDNENSAQTRMLINQFDGIKLFRQVIPMTYEHAVEMINKDELAGAVMIPEDFTSSVANGENKPLTVIGNSRRPLQSYVIRNLMLSAADLVTAGQNAIRSIYYYDEKAGMGKDELNKNFNDSASVVMMQTLARNEIFTDEEGTSGGYPLSSAEYFTAALISIFLMFSGMPAIKLLLTEKNLGLMARLRASPVKIWQVVLSKFLVSAVLSVIQFLSIIIFTLFVFHNYWGAPVRSILMVFGAVLFAVSAWSVFVSAVASTTAAADALGYLGILLMAVIGGCIYPIAGMPGFIKAASGFTISRWSMQGFMTLFSGERTAGVIPGVYQLLAIGGVLLALAFIRLQTVRKA